MASRRTLALAALGLAWAAGAAAQDAAAPDRSGRELRGQASVYAADLNGRRMADGGIFEPASDTVASNVLPLGTVARVTNLRNGRTAIVRVRDSGDFATGRVVNVSPKVAEFLGMRDGVARVSVTPLAVPQPGGRFRLGAGTGAPGQRAAQPPAPDRRAAPDRLP